MQLIAITSEIEIKKHPKSNHTPSSRTSRKDHRKRKRKTTSCMDVLFLVKEYFRIQRNLFNSLWNLKYLVYKKEIPKAGASRTSLMSERK